MKIHSDVLSTVTIRESAQNAGVWFIRLTEHGSRSRSRSFDVALGGNSPYRSQADRDEFAATWDQWGIFIRQLFEIDPDAIIGQYRSFDAFSEYTGYRFDTLALADAHRIHRWEYGGVMACKCGATLNRWAL